jgi:hypothetical protein
MTESFEPGKKAGVDPEYVWGLVLCYLKPEVVENVELYQDLRQRVLDNAETVDAAIGPFVREYLTKDSAKKGSYLSAGTNQPLRYCFYVGPFRVSNIPQPSELARDSDFEEANARFKRAIGLE